MRSLVNFSDKNIHYKLLKLTSNKLDGNLKFMINRY